MLPSSVRHPDQAVTRFGATGRAYLDGLDVGDPLADAVVADFTGLGGPGRGMRLLRRAITDGIDAVPDAPDSFRTLFAQLDEVPAWADLDAIDAALGHLPRYNRQAGIVLGAASLLAGYANTNASRPLQMTGRYIDSAGMRTIEVASWLRETARVGGVRRHAPGFERTVRVRMIHALVRHHLSHSPEWDLAAWGVPISQGHLAYTLTEFCLIPLRGMAGIGAPYLPHEVDGYYALWRYVGHLLGIGPDLLPVDEADQRRLEELHLLTRPEVEDFCRDLVRGINTEFLVPEIEQLLPGPLHRYAPSTVHALERVFLGDPIADELAIPQTPLPPTIRRIGRALGAVNRTLDRSSLLLDVRTRLGTRYADKQDARLRDRYAVRHQMVDDSPESGTPHPARVA